MSLTVTNKELMIAKIRPNAKVPSKKEEDAGYDVYACFDEDFFVIEPGQTKAIPTGIAAAFSSEYYIQIEERSSMAKLGIKKSGGVFDSGYRGEYFIMTYNTNKMPFVISKIEAEKLADTFEINGKKYNKNECIIYPYTKAVCQMVVQIIPKLEVKEISYEELSSIESERGDAGFGSSGK